MQQSGLTPEELNRVLSRAAERQRDAAIGAGAEPRTSSREAEAIAEELGIAPEHVRAALAESRAGVPARNSSGGRLRPALRWGGIGALVAGGALLALGPTLLGILLLLLGAGALAFSFLLGGRRSSAASARENLPVAGTCRVCGAPAYNERATFCEEHQYRGVGSGGAG